MPKCIICQPLFFLLFFESLKSTKLGNLICWSWIYLGKKQEELKVFWLCLFVFLLTFFFLFSSKTCLLEIWKPLFLHFAKVFVLEMKMAVSPNVFPYFGKLSKVQFWNFNWISNFSHQHFRSKNEIGIGLGYLTPYFSKNKADGEVSSNTLIVSSSIIFETIFLFPIVIQSFFYPPPSSRDLSFKRCFDVFCSS